LKTFKQLILSLLLFNASFTQAQYQSTGQTIEKIIAKVDHEIVLMSELETAYIQYRQSGNIATPDLKCNVLETLIINKLLVAKAGIDSVTVEENMISKELDRRIEYVLSQFGGNEDDLVASYGKTVVELKEELRPQIREQMLVQRMQGKITGQLKMTPQEIRVFFEKIPKDSLPFISTEVEIGQIVRYPKASNRQENDVYNRLAELKKRVENAEDFCQLASIYSEDPGSKDLCGRLGYRKRGELVPEFEGAALSMEPGEVSDPIKSQFGYHLIRLIDRRGNEYAAQHILITVKTDESDLDLSLQLLDSLRSQIIDNDSIKFNMLAHRYNEDEASKGMGNRITDKSRNTRVSAENLDHNIYFTIDGMKEGDITEPLKFVTPEGKTAARILYLISKKDPHVANLEDDYQKISTAALEAKRAKVLDEWFKKTLPEVYIYIDPEYKDCKVLKID
jgi:peptidyl-prolyl cis-trans isomerase SurA